MAACDSGAFRKLQALAEFRGIHLIQIRQLQRSTVEDRSACR